MNGASWLLSSCSVPKTLETLKDLKQMHAYTSNCTKEIAYSRFLFFFHFLLIFVTRMVSVMLPHFLILMISLLFQQERKNADGGHMANRKWSAERTVHCALHWRVTWFRYLLMTLFDWGQSQASGTWLSVLKGSSNLETHTAKVFISFSAHKRVFVLLGNRVGSVVPSLWYYQH